MQGEPVVQENQQNKEQDSQLILISKLFTKPKHAEFIKNATQLYCEKAHFYHNQFPGIISAIKHISFPVLILLHLSYNNIDSLQHLPFLDCPNLKALHLSFNRITQAKPLRKCKFPSLQKLSIMGNKIYEYETFNEFNFPILTSAILQDLKNQADRKCENPALFAKFKSRKLATFTIISKSVPHVRTMIKN